MKRCALILSLALLAVPSALAPQSIPVSSNPMQAVEGAYGGSGGSFSAHKKRDISAKPFSRLVFGQSASPLGIGLQMTTNINRHFNVRGQGNLFDYSTNILTNGFNVDAKVNLASAGASLDVYPFHAGLRFSPGVLFYNGNQISANGIVASGTSITLDNQTFYSANLNPITGSTPMNADGLLNLHTTKPAFTLTTGWGNMIPRKGGHWSFPIEIGVAFIGDPALKVNLTGWVCQDAALTMCADLANTADPIAQSAQSALQSQVAKWNSDINQLKTYPILSSGIAYSFRVR